MERIDSGVFGEGGGHDAWFTLQAPAFNKLHDVRTLSTIQQVQRPQDTCGNFSRPLYNLGRQ